MRPEPSISRICVPGISLATRKLFVDGIETFRFPILLSSAHDDIQVLIDIEGCVGLKLGFVGSKRAWKDKIGQEMDELLRIADH